MRKINMLLIVFLFMLLAPASTLAQPNTKLPQEDVSAAATCYNICAKAGVNSASPMRQPADDYQRTLQLGMDWMLEIAFKPDDLLRTIEAINRAHDHQLKPIVRICAGSSCEFGDPLVYAQFLRDVSTQVKGDFWAILGPNEPDLEPWAGGPEGVASYMNTVLAQVADIPNLRTVSPTFNLSNSVTHRFFSRMEAAGARFAQLDAFSGTSYTVAGNGAYYYYAHNTGHAETMRKKLIRYNKQIIFTEYGTFGMFDKPGENNPARGSIVQEMKKQFQLAANDPYVLGILHFDAYGTNGTPHMYYDPEMIEISRDTQCTTSRHRESGVGYSTQQTLWQFTGEPGCQEITYGCPFLSASTCSASACIDNDGDGYAGEGGTCTRVDCDDRVAAYGEACVKQPSSEAGEWGLLTPIVADAPNFETWIWPSILVRSDDTPFIAYHDGRIGKKDLVALDCTAPDCSKALRRRLAVEDQVGMFLSTTLRDDGTPLLAHLDLIDLDFEIYSCDDPGCVTGLSRIVDYETGYWGFDTSVVTRADGRPMLAYWHSDFQDLRVYDCADASCSSGVIRDLDVGGMTGYAPSIILAEDFNPLIIYGHFNPYKMYAFHCDNPDCTSGQKFDLGSYGNYSMASYPTRSLAIGQDGLPVFVYRNPNNNGLIFYTCETFDCSNVTSNPKHALDKSASVVQSRIIMLEDGLPFIVYRLDLPDGKRQLNLLRCLDASCQTFETTSVQERQIGLFDVALRTNGYPLVVFHDYGTGELVLYDITFAPPPTITPSPTTETPVPTTETPVPTTETPAPTIETPVPTTETPVPTTETPVPTTETPVPTTETPAPTIETPVPTTETPVPTTETPVPTTETPPVDDVDFDELIDAIENACQDGLIRNNGLCNSLISKVENAQTVYEKGNIKSAINKLKAMHSEIEAQAGSGIDMETANTLLSILEELIKALEALG